MEWFYPTNELPKIPKNKTYVRCLAYCYLNNGLESWIGYIDVFYNPSIGWTRSEDKKMSIEILLWSYWKEPKDLT